MQESRLPGKLGEVPGMPSPRPNASSWPEYETSRLAQVASIALLALGVSLAIFGLLLVLGLELPHVVAAGVNLVGLPFLAVGLLHIATGWAGWNHRRWAQVVGIVIGTIGVWFGSQFLASVNNPLHPSEAGSVWPAMRWLIVGSMVPYALVALGLLLGNRHFTHLVSAK
jgi:hypothetical protein